MFGAFGLIYSGKYAFMQSINLYLIEQGIYSGKPQFLSYLIDIFIKMLYACFLYSRHIK